MSAAAAITHWNVNKHWQFALLSVPRDSTLLQEFPLLKESLDCTVVAQVLQCNSIFGSKDPSGNLSIYNWYNSGIFSFSKCPVLLCWVSYFFKNATKYLASKKNHPRFKYLS